MPHRPRYALFAALGLTLAAVACWALTFQIAAGDHWDKATLQGLVDLRARHWQAHQLATLCDPAEFVLIALGFVGIALLRHRPRVGLVVVFVTAGANLTTQSLKPLLGATRFSDFLGGAQITSGSWPSGHATAAMALALCAVLVSPPRLRPLVALAGVAFTLGVSVSLLILGWHYPSDVVAGLLISAIWMALGIAALWAADARWPVRSGRDAVARARGALPPSRVLAPPAVGAVCALVLAGLVAINRPGSALAYAQDHTSSTIFLLALTWLALTLAAGLALALRR
jgi:membrane-associated phospholipid phosphatase